MATIPSVAENRVRGAVERPFPVFRERQVPGQSLLLLNGAPAAGCSMVPPAFPNEGVDVQHCLNGLSADDRSSALANAASALAGRNEVPRAIEADAEALRTADGQASIDPRAIKALAAGGNNLAGVLEKLQDRSAQQTEAMVGAAEAALRFWKQAGTWVEEQIAFYRVAQSQLHAGQSAAAARSAEQCLEICASNAAPAIDRFFAHAVVAIAHRAAGNGSSYEAHKRAALGYLETLSDEKKEACESDRKELEG